MKFFLLIALLLPLLSFGAVTVGPGTGSGGGSATNAVTSINGDTTGAQSFTTSTTGTTPSISNPGGGSHVWIHPWATNTASGFIRSNDWSRFWAHGAQIGALSNAATDLQAATQALHTALSSTVSTVSTHTGQISDHDGRLTVLEAGGGSQTPWASTINGAGYALTNAGNLTSTGDVQAASFTGVGATPPIFGLPDTNTGKMFALTIGAFGTLASNLNLLPPLDGLGGASGPLIFTGYATNGTNVTLDLLPVGTDGQVLKVASGVAGWGTDNNSGSGSTQMVTAAVGNLSVTNTAAVGTLSADQVNVATGVDLNFLTGQLILMHDSDHAVSAVTIGSGITFSSGTLSMTSVPLLTNSLWISAAAFAPYGGTTLEGGRRGATIGSITNAGGFVLNTYDFDDTTNEAVAINFTLGPAFAGLISASLHWTHAGNTNNASVWEVAMSPFSTNNALSNYVWRTNITMRPYETNLLQVTTLPLLTLTNYTPRTLWSLRVSLLSTNASDTLVGDARFIGAQLGVVNTNQMGGF